jgi:hypothetical protein
MTTLATITGTSIIITEGLASIYFKEIVPTATNKEFFNITDSSIIRSKTINLTYFLILPESTLIRTRLVLRLDTGSSIKIVLGSATNSTLILISYGLIINLLLALIIIVIRTLILTNLILIILTRIILNPNISISIFTNSNNNKTYNSFVLILCID